MRPVSFISAASVRLSVTTSSARVDMGASIEEATVKISNTGLNELFYEFGDVTVVATVATGISLLPGEVLLVTKERGQRYVAAITASGASTLSVSLGAGQ